MTLQSIVFLLIAVPVFSYAGFRLKQLFEMARAHQGQGRTLDRLGERVKTTIANVLGQQAVLRDRKAGLMHTTIFWGFIIITIGTVEQFATTLYAPLTFDFIGHAPYSALVFLQDVLTFAVLAAVAYAFYRRVVIRPTHLGKSTDAMIILTLTASLMASILFMNGFHILGAEGGAGPWYKNAMPISKIVALWLTGFEFSPEMNETMGTVFKWVHMLIVLGFTAYIPSSKHLHVLAAGPNTFLRSLDRAKGMKPIDFANEKITQYGAAKVTDLSWKDALDYYSCTECGRCQELCPAWNTQKPLSPKNLIIDLKENLYRNKEKILKGKIDEVTPLIDESVTEDVIWACTSCRACEIACPVFIEHTDKIFESRRNLVMMESKFPQEVQTVFKNMETNSTPWAFSAQDRAQWADGLGIKTMAEDPNPEYLLWVGCAGSYDDRNKKVLKSIASLLKKAEIRFSILGCEEKCTGDPARRIGNEYLFQQLAQANVETLNKYGVKKIVTGCPHCFNTLKNEYGAFGGNYEVVHHSELIAHLISGGKLKPVKSPTGDVNSKITFHDSCYLGRWNGIYKQPRATLEALGGTKLVEMKSTGDKSLCCGAGGGRMWMEEKIGKRVNIARTEQALETQAAVVASSCPFCITMITDGVKSKDMQDKVKVMDIAELVDQSTV